MTASLMLDLLGVHLTTFKDILISGMQNTINETLSNIM